MMTSNQAGMLACMLFIILVNLPTEAKCQDSKCRHMLTICAPWYPIKQQSDNCNITRHYQYIELTSSAMMNNQNSQRYSKSELKKPWENVTGDCYIEAIADRHGTLLFLRFSDRRSVFDGKTESWQNFLDVLKIYESKPDGMQLVMDFTTFYTCEDMETKQLENPSYNIFARFNDRSLISYMPLGSYDSSQFRATIAFNSTLSDMVQVSDTSKRLYGWDNSENFVYQYMLRHPLTLWLYKCPASHGIGNLPCNSEVNVYLRLRQWINRSVLWHMDNDFFKPSDWWLARIKQDYFALILVPGIAAWILVQVTCLTWFGLDGGGQNGVYI